MSVPHAAAPKHELLCPATTRRAASPYFSWTTSLIASVMTVLLYCFTCSKQSFSAQWLYCVCSIRHKESREVLPMTRRSPYNAETSLRVALRPDLHSLTCPDGGKVWSWGFQALRQFRLPPFRPDGSSTAGEGSVIWLRRPGRRACRQSASHPGCWFCWPFVLLYFYKYRNTERVSSALIVTVTHEGLKRARGLAAVLVSGAGVNSFISDDQRHGDCGNGISPPPTEPVIKQQSGEQDCSKIGTEIGLFGVRAHGCAIQFEPDLPFGP